MQTKPSVQTFRKVYPNSATAHGHYVVVEVVGGKDNPTIVPVEILHFTETKKILGLLSLIRDSLTA